MSDLYSKINQVPGTHLCISDQFGVCDINQLQLFGIKHIFNVSSIPLDPLPGITYTHTPLWDDPGFDITQHFDRLFSAFDQIASRGEKLVINCQVGRSRSASVIIGYLIFKGMTYEDAYSLLKSCRDIKPNGGFVNQLKQYSIKLNALGLPKSHPLNSGVV